MNPEEITKVAEKMYVENCADKTAFSLFMNGFQCGAQWRLEFDNAQKDKAESEPSTSTNNDSQQLCRSCKKVHLCINSDDLTEKCKLYERYSPQQQAVS